MLKPLMFFIIFILSACTSPDAAQGPKPKLLSRVLPVYPIYAHDHQIEGYVKVRFDVGIDGKISEVRIIDSKPRGLFDDKAIIAMAQWRYEKNKPYKNMSSTIHFKMSK
ncbi:MULTISPECIES: TonB family protein [Serratia]|jgi:protein TonB|uniref:Membrane protein n=1 Tax=Serratia grimesii TaxID=82995 RepID=A0A9C7V7G1_9GAMM|nr:TonB family protein [Serratia grimesii]KFB88779.1 membrane protein [Serratia grimesii]CAI0806495.1 transport protein TonB [Serratia grimesii]CAI2789702.1 transport protein TonB [Serratia grimesii]HCK00408.1 TonB family protein [Serratia grimesii]